MIGLGHQSQACERRAGGQGGNAWPRWKIGGASNANSGFEAMSRTVASYVARGRRREGAVDEQYGFVGEIKDFAPPWAHSPPSTEGAVGPTRACVPAELENCLANVTCGRAAALG